MCSKLAVVVWSSCSQSGLVQSHVFAQGHTLDCNSNYHVYHHLYHILESDVFTIFAVDGLCTALLHGVCAHSQCLWGEKLQVDCLICKLLRCIFHHSQGAGVQPFASPARAIAHTMVQIVGEVDFEAIFNQGDFLYNPLITAPVLFISWLGLIMYISVHRPDSNSLLDLNVRLQICSK